MVVFLTGLIVASDIYAFVVGWEGKCYIYLFILFFKIISEFVIFMFTHKDYQSNNNLKNKRIREIYK